MRAERRDDNEPELLKVVRRVGGYWVKAPPLDGWAWAPRIQEWTPVEIKRPDKEGRKDEFTDTQKKLLAEFSDRRIRHFVWRTADDVVRDLGGRQ